MGAALVSEWDAAKSSQWSLSTFQRFIRRALQFFALLAAGMLVALLVGIYAENRDNALMPRGCLTQGPRVSRSSDIRVKHPKSDAPALRTSGEGRQFPRRTNARIPREAHRSHR